MRDRFDQLLARSAEAAGASLFTRTLVDRVATVGERIELRAGAAVFTARFIVAADGVSSVVARKAGLPELTAVVPALESEVTVDQESLARFRDIARFDFGLTPHGYGWVFPKREHLSIGVLTTRRGSCNLNVELARYLEALSLRVLSEERHGYMIPLRPRDDLFAAQRILLVGDAAGLADPVTAEGISAAVISGQLAAKAILGGGGDDRQTRRLYREHLHGALLRDLRIARVLAKFLYHYPRLRSWAFRHHGEGLTELMMRVVSGDTSYRAEISRIRNLFSVLGLRLRRSA